MVVSVPFRPQIRTAVRQNYKDRVLSVSSGVGRRQSNFVDFLLVAANFIGK